MRDGDPSPDGAGPLVSARGIEIGHIFQLGRKYTDAFAADVLGEDGKPVRLTMGSYGIGVSRLVAVIAEQHHDELGLRWPSSVSPFDVHVVIANKDADGPRGRRRSWPRDLDRLGLEVLLDDRTASPGVKFKDAELLGVPWIVVVGRGWADGVVELRNRFTGESRRDGSPRSTARAGRARSPQPAARSAAGVASYSLPPGKATVIGDDAEHLVPPGGQHRATRSARSPRTRGPARQSACSSTARHATAESSSIRTASFAASAGVVDRERQLVAGGGQRSRRPSARRASRSPPRGARGAGPSPRRPGRCRRACDAPTPSRSRRSRRARWRRRRTGPPCRRRTGRSGVGVGEVTGGHGRFDGSATEYSRGAGRGDGAEQTGAVAGQGRRQLGGARRRTAQRWRRRRRRLGGGAGGRRRGGRSSADSLDVGVGLRGQRG